MPSLNRNFHKGETAPETGEVSVKERLRDFEKGTKCILDSDTFLARSDYKGLTEIYADIHSLLSVLEQTKMLEPYCKANKISVKKARAFLALYQDLASGEPKSVKKHNEHFVSKHLKEERYYLDHILQDVDAGIYSMLICFFCCRLVITPK